MSFQLVPKSVTRNDLERRNGPYFALFHGIRWLRWRTVFCVKVVDDVVVKSLRTFARGISSPGEFLIEIYERTDTETLIAILRIPEAVCCGRPDNRSSRLNGSIRVKNRSISLTSRFRAIKSTRLKID